MSAVPERLDTLGRELPIDVAASVMFLKSMGCDHAAGVLRDGWFGPQDQNPEEGRLNNEQQ